jgi:ABC-2 type transport system permease protein
MIADARPVTPPRRFGAVNWLGLFTLIRREATRALKNYNYQVLGPVVANLLYLAVFSLALSGQTNAPDFVAFIVPGLIAFALCETAFEAACGSFIFDKHERIIADMLMAPLNAAERTLGYLAGASGAGLAVGGAVALAFLFFVRLEVTHLWALIFFALSGAALHALIGILVGIRAERWDSYSAVHTFLLMPLSFLSGLFYHIEQLPEFAQTLVRLNPIFYVIDGFRYGMTGQASAPPILGIAVLIGIDALLFLVAYAWFRRGYRLKP